MYGFRNYLPRSHTSFFPSGTRKSGRFQHGVPEVYKRLHPGIQVNTQRHFHLTVFPSLKMRFSNLISALALTFLTVTSASPVRQYGRWLISNTPLTAQQIPSEQIRDVVARDAEVRALRFLDDVGVLTFLATGWSSHRFTELEGHTRHDQPCRLYFMPGDQSSGLDRSRVSHDGHAQRLRLSGRNTQNGT